MMKKLTSFIIATSLFIGAGLLTHVKAQSGTDILINFTSDIEKDPHSSLMGLHMAKMAQQQGKNVTLFLNVHGVKLATKKLSKTKFAKEKMSDLLEEILGNDGVLLVCPHCMEIEEIKENQLIDGAIVASPEKMKELLQSDFKSFTY